MDYNADICPFRHVIDDIGDKWSLLIIVALKERSLRFSELKREIPDISQRMLTQTLRGLERDGYVTRHVTPSIPPRVDYAMSPLGTELCDAIGPLSTWAAKNRGRVVAARASYDGRTAV